MWKINTYAYMYELMLFLLFTFLATSGVVPDPVYCPNNCGSRYTGVKRKGNLNSHLRHECGGQRKFQCSYCSRWFTKKNSLKTHRALVHKIIFI